jgi:uncharacterized protein
MNVLITGGTGFIGSALTRSLRTDGHQVVIFTRHPEKTHLPQGVQAIGWDGHTVTGWLDVFSQADAVVNLAGTSIGQWPWSAARKKAILNSRVDAGVTLAHAFQRAAKKPGVLIQASGIGYYGPRGQEPVDESSPAGNDFVATIALEWEASTKLVDALGVRRVSIRTGLVLGRGGILPLMALPVRLFAGGPLGSGQQGVSWIHLDDEVRAIRFLLDNEKARGAYNLTAPNPLSNADFMCYMSKALRRPYWLPVPAFAMRTALGEMSTLILAGQYALPQRLVNLGFTFKFESAFDAFKAIF